MPFFMLFFFFFVCFWGGGGGGEGTECLQNRTANILD